MHYRRWAWLALVGLLLAATPRTTPVVRAKPTRAVLVRQAEARRFAAARQGLTPRVALVILETAERYRLRRAVVFGLVRLESGYRPDRTGRAGEIGLVQILPSTAAQVCGVRDTVVLRRIDVNLDCGFGYLRRNLNRYGNDYVLALTAYNAGPRPVTALRQLADSLGYAAKVTQSPTRLFASR